MTPTRLPDSRVFGVLRPEPGNAATARRLEALGHRTLRLPLFGVRSLAWAAPDPGDYDCLVLTSANAVRHGGPGLTRLTGLPVHAVGEATAAAARAAGFWIAAIGDGGTGGLEPPGRVLRLAGREHSALAGADTIIVYASEALAPDLTQLTGGIALLHSSRAAATFAARMPQPHDVAIAALSSAVAAAAGTGWRAVVVAERPTDAALIATAVGLAD